MHMGFVLLDNNGLNNTAQICRINLYRDAIDFAGGALLKRNNNKYLCIYKIYALPRPTVKHYLYKLVLYVYQIRKYPLKLVLKSIHVLINSRCSCIPNRGKIGKAC